MNLVNKSAETSANLSLKNFEAISCQEEEKNDVSEKLEQLAMLLAETWKDFHPDAQNDSEKAFESCVFCVTNEMATAGKAVAGSIGMEIITGGASAAAKVVCSRVLSIK
ncbi:MAG: hypothetical protein U7123_07575 [Potamolinea sp.]